MSGTQRWLVTGACGQFGAHACALLRSRGAETLGLNRTSCAGDHGEVLRTELGHPEKLDRILTRYAPTHILHLAGIASPTKADRDQVDTWTVHVAVTQRLAAFAAATGAWLLYPSTDFVWDGRRDGRYAPSDPPTPTTLYGRYKTAGERTALASGAAAVVRFPLMVGLPVCPRPTTWTRMVEAIRAGQTLPACVDEFRTPLSFVDAAAVAVELGVRRAHGLFHAAGPEVLSPHDILSRIAVALGQPPRLKEISRMDLPGGRQRPRNVAMDASALTALLPANLPQPLSVETMGKLLAVA
ncbi:SDR family oxidoreductase [Amycolatopsis suaedae]|uniref:SDR family oxidoreductase n=1 Tax=Amycolatopsis suaedae TaxID=2510978 RepID=UPI0013EEF4D3|nr:sugar nucleotide-binding protein [Amycolatopsis suaedae]